MRKYRGKHVETGEWIYGYLIGDDVIVGDIVDWDEEYFCTEFWYKVDPEAVGQYTGYKDKLEVEIYEGDILEFEDVGEEGYEYREGFDFTNRAVVSFENGRYELSNFLSSNSAVCEEMRTDNHEQLTRTIQFSRIKGNIYDHKHLIKPSWGGRP